MINSQMKLYNYFLYGVKDEYGQLSLSNTASGKVKIAINISSQSIQDNILYKDCSYIGLTHDANINDKYVIEYNGKKLKVLYINPIGRYKQVFMSEM